MKTIKLKEEESYITLGQLLKYAGIIQTGGEAKWFLAETPVLVNGIGESRRGKKLLEGDQIQIDGHGTFIIRKN